MNTALWLVQALLAVAFGMGGVIKITRPISELAQAMVWPGDVPVGLVRFIGTAELLGGIGLIVPVLARIKPVLTPVAAGALAAFVAWGRLHRAPIAAR